jgi:WD40 repeat protein
MKVKLWDVTTGKLIRTFSGHEGRIETLALSFDRKILATGSGDETAKLWDVQTGRLLWTSPDHGRAVWKIFFSPDGKRFLTMTAADEIGDKNEIRMWETATGKLLGKMPGAWWQSFFSPDWKRFVTVGKKKNTIEIYEVTD